MKKTSLIFLVVALAIVSMFTLVACGGNDGNSTNGDTVKSNQLSVVTNVNYTTNGYKFTWDKVQNADSYNLKINSENITQNGIKNNEFAYYPKDITKPIKVQLQAVDSTGNYSTSNWSSEKEITFEDKNPLMTCVMGYANNHVNGNLTGLVAAYKNRDERDDQNFIVMILTSKVDGKDKITSFSGEIQDGTDLTSLDTIIKSNPRTSRLNDYFLVVDDKGVAINSMDYLLNSDLNSTALKSNYINKGYTISVVSSYTGLDHDDTIGKNTTVYAVVKATKGTDEKYLYVEYDCRVDSINHSIQHNVTTGLLTDRYVHENRIVELKGDFVEASIPSVNVAK